MLPASIFPLAGQFTFGQNSCDASFSDFVLVIHHSLLIDALFQNSTITRPPVKGVLPHKHVQFNILTFVLVLALLVIGSISIAHRVQATEDESALKKVVLDAFTAPSSLVVLPNTTEDLSMPIESSAIENKRGQTKKLLTDIYPTFRS